MARLATAGCAAALALLAGCGSLKPYPNDLQPKNLTIHTATRAGSVFASVRAELDVHSVDGACRTRYLGTVELDQPSVAVGIASGSASYLVFHFISSNFLGSSRGRISRDVMLRPLPDQRYEIDVTYRDDLYDVTIHERSSRGGPAREVPMQDLRACRPQVSHAAPLGSG
jgi:hypothetical protein